MAFAVIMPRQGQSVESCIITKWHKQVGDDVMIGDILFSYETDKASFDEESPVEGKVLAILAQEDDDVPCLVNVCVIGQEGEDISKFMSKDEQEEQTADIIEEEKPTAPQAVVETTKSLDDDERLKISPRAKNIAINQNLDLSKAVPTGPYGRIIERDVLKLAKQGYKITAAAKEAYQGGSVGTGLGGAVTTGDLNNKIQQAAQSAITMAGEASFKDVKLSSIRKAISKAMHASLSQMAQLTLNASFDATDILAFRKKIKENMEAFSLNNITINDIILYAVSRVLKNHKELNAHFLDNKMRLFNNVNLGMAVDTDRGLLVPTLYNADTKSLNEISAETKELALMAQSGKISPDLIANATFTITNLGTLGVESFTPVINPPQTGILGVCTLEEKVKKINGVIDTYPSITLSLTFDHRAVDGAPAARFLKDVCTALENFSLTIAK